MIDLARIQNRILKSRSFTEYWNSKWTRRFAMVMVLIKKIAAHLKIVAGRNLGRRSEYFCSRSATAPLFLTGLQVSLEDFASPKISRILFRSITSFGVFPVRSSQFVKSFSFTS
jgi:hypothetical protein